MTSTPFFISIDFDGTISDVDVTDAIIQRFAKPGWEEAEDLWEKGIIGSRECLAQQMRLISASMNNLLDFVDRFPVRPGFAGFIDFLEQRKIPFGIVSDGFGVFIKRMLENAGLGKAPVYASRLIERNGTIETFFPFSSDACPSGVCKCRLARDLSGGLPVVHIGDGRSDFCLADKADFVFAKGDLADFCAMNSLPHCSFDSFSDIEEHVMICSLTSRTAAGNFMNPLLGR